MKLYGEYREPISDDYFKSLFEDHLKHTKPYTVFFRDFYIDFRWKKEDGYIVAILYCEDGQNRGVDFSFEVVIYDENGLTVEQVIERFELNKDLAVVKKILNA